MAVSPYKPTAIITASLLLFVSLSANMSNGSQFGDIHWLYIQGILTSAQNHRKIRFGVGSNLTSLYYGD